VSLFAHISNGLSKRPLLFTIKQGDKTTKHRAEVEGESSLLSIRLETTHHLGLQNVREVFLLDKPLGSVEVFERQMSKTSERGAHRASQIGRPNQTCHGQKRDAYLTGSAYLHSTLYLCVYRYSYIPSHVRYLARYLVITFSNLWLVDYPCAQPPHLTPCQSGASRERCPRLRVCSDRDLEEDLPASRIERTLHS
jgi:hypothetical protein